MTEFEFVNNIMIIKNDECHSKWIKETERLDHNQYHLTKTQIILDKFFPNRNHGCLILDIGAHWGTHTIFFARQNTDVVAFEPNPDNFKCLSHNLSKYSHVKLVNSPVSDKAEHVELKNPSTTQNGTFQCHPSEDSDMVCKTIDSYNFKYIVYIKIDVEGYEKKVLDGAIDTILKYKPIIDIEVSCYRDSYDSIMKWITENNYIIYDSVGEDIQKDLLLVHRSFLY